MTKTLTVKKTITILATTSFAFSLSACGNKAQTPQKNNLAKTTATITLDFENDQKIDETKTITIAKNQSLLEALKENFKIEETDGFITAIDDHAQDTAANKYWLFNINGKMADKGAADIQLKKGDEVAFYLGSF
ncbi:hypothetical protein Hs30E_09880 [Lactococcus hodotermopsidis]|uniref:Transcobalamin-like C-terminal domain-containing protein n=1 Tax=Pseudolactococcus hodotermopsidis TaxID=2709157 RepID=A0A6A0BF19_9LACT|nr:DUF4430 domain-containing protein [Lactococcus hodotermopsidis]GFH42437.1 hypothetical protein Hs30E_09880 [Lactococcus hodotermopsidis]